MRTLVIIAILLAVLIIVIALVATYYSLTVGRNLLDLNETVEAEVDRAREIRDRFVNTFSPLVDLTKEDATEFLSNFAADHCIPALFKCNVYEFPSLYDNKHCIPACEALIATQALCRSDTSLENNAVCQLIPNFTLDSLAEATDQTIPEILEEMGIPPSQIPSRMKDRFL